MDYSYTFYIVSSGNPCYVYTQTHVMLVQLIQPVIDNQMAVLCALIDVKMLHVLIMGHVWR